MSIFESHSIESYDDKVPGNLHLFNQDSCNSNGNGTHLYVDLTTDREVSLMSGTVKEDEISRLASENEKMTNALVAITSHFAQVQLRLSQVLNADGDTRDDMLKSLDEFASRGLPELSLLAANPSTASGDSSTVRLWQKKSLKLIEDLRVQLNDLERYAYEAGEQKEPPTQDTLEKQRMVLDHLCNRLELNLDDMTDTPSREVKQAVDVAVRQLLDPLKINANLVEQLKTQVVDLERFIDFLHGSGSCGELLSQALLEFKRAHQHKLLFSEKDLEQANPSADLEAVREQVEPDSTSGSLPGIHLGRSRHLNKTPTDASSPTLNGKRSKVTNGNRSHQRSRESIVTLMQRALAILQVFAASQLVSANEDWLTKLKKRNLSHDHEARTSSSVEHLKLRHWGTTRARLELAIEAVLEKVMLLRSCRLDASTKPTNSVSNTSQAYSCTSTRGPSEHHHSTKGSHGVIAKLVINEDSIIDQSLPGSRIALPVQHLHDINLKSMLPQESSGSSVASEKISIYGKHGTLGACLPAASGDSHSDTVEFLCNEAQRMVMRVVRRYLSPALRDLIEHGLIKRAVSLIDGDGSLHRGSYLLIRQFLGCFQKHGEVCDDVDGLDLLGVAGKEGISVNSSHVHQRSHRASSGIHAWHVLLHFYYAKEGHLYNQSPARRLSESFNLDSVGGKAITNRQRFFSAIGAILEAHSAYRRSDDAKFKAFVSIALNERKLVPWLRLILSWQPLVDRIYESWSYTKSTGFTDALHSLDRLSRLDFNLPYNYSMSHLSDSRDAF